MENSTSDSRGAGGRDKSSGRGGGGRNPWGQGRARSSAQAFSGRRTVPEECDNCLLCDKHHSTQSCRFLRKCRKLLVDKFKTSKEEKAAVAEESEDSTEDDICFMVHEDLTGTSSTTDIVDIPDLVEDSDSEDDEFQMIVTTVRIDLIFLAIFIPKTT